MVGRKPRGGRRGGFVDDFKTVNRGESISQKERRDMFTHPSCDYRGGRGGRDIQTGVWRERGLTVENSWAQQRLLISMMLLIPAPSHKFG